MMQAREYLEVGGLRNGRGVGVSVCMNAAVWLFIRAVVQWGILLSCLRLRCTKSYCMRTSDLCKIPERVALQQTPHSLLNN